MKEPTGMLARWAVHLQGYDFTLKHRKGDLNVVPDTLSRTNEQVAAVEINVNDIWYQKMLNNINLNPENFPQWQVKDGILYKRIVNRDAFLVDVSEWKQVIPYENRIKILEKYHDQPLAAHFKIFKTRYF